MQQLHALVQQPCTGQTINQARSLQPVPPPCNNPLPGQQRTLCFAPRCSCSHTRSITHEGKTLLQPSPLASDWRTAGRCVSHLLSMREDPWITSDSTPTAQMAPPEPLAALQFWKVLAATCRCRPEAVMAPPSPVVDMPVKLQERTCTLGALPPVIGGASLNTPSSRAPPCEKGQQQGGAGGEGGKRRCA